jgi:hypothetical protein
MSKGGSFQVSPGVLTREIDDTNVVAAVSTSIGAFAGSFSWGPVEEPVLIGSEKQLAQVFGEPNASNSLDFLVAASFLEYSNSLWVSRATDTGVITASDDGLVDQAIKSDADFERFLYEQSLLSPVPSTQFVARYPGLTGNKVAVKFYAFGSDAVAAGFDYNPTSTAEVNGVPSYSYADGEYIYDEVHVAVLLDGVVVEKYSGLSFATDAKDEQGSNIYFKDVLNRDSQYVRVGDLVVTGLDTEASPQGDLTLNLDFAGLAVINDAYDYTGDSPADSPVLDSPSALLLQRIPTFLNAASYALSGGVSGTVAADNAVNAINAFADAELIDVSLIFTSAVNLTGSEWSATEVKINDIVTSRKDAVGFISAPMQVVNANGAQAKLDLVYKDVTSGKFSYQGSKHNSYLVFDSSPVQVYNKYLDKYQYIPACGHMAGLCAATDLIADPWFSPAGFNRGRVQGVSKLAYNPQKQDRDLLYKGGVNFMTAFPGEGIILYGDKTGQTKPSAFDRINVRRLFIVLEKAIAKAAKFQLFELNDEFTRATFRNMVIPFLREIQGRRGIDEFRVVCDASNNGGEIIDTNQFVGEIYVKPARSINFITLNFIATRTGVEFSEIVGS